MKEENITLIQEANSIFLGHAAPTSSSDNEIKDALYKSFPSNTFHHLKVIGCDSTPTNTGANGGFFTLIEKIVGHSVQRVICLLHTNESVSYTHLTLPTIYSV